MTRRWIGPVACALALAPVPGAAAGVRPSLPLAVGGDNFVVHYATSGADATTPEHAAEQLGVLERSRAFWLARGYPAPTPDDEADARVDLYLSGTTLQPSVDGTTAGVAPFAGPGNVRSSSYIVLRPTAPAHAASHELFHAIQDALTRAAPSWMAEATAEWAAAEVLAEPPIGLRSYLRDPSLPVDCAVDQVLAFPCSYGRAAYFASVARHHGADVIRALYEELDRRGATQGQAGAVVPALEAVLAVRGSSVAAAYGEFAADGLAALAATPATFPNTIAPVLGSPSWTTRTSALMPRLAGRLVDVEVAPPGACRYGNGVTARVVVARPPGGRAFLVRPGTGGRVLTVAFRGTGRTLTATTPVAPDRGGCRPLFLALANPTTAEGARFSVAVSLRDRPSTLRVAAPRSVRLPARVLVTGRGTKGAAYLAARCGARKRTTRVRVPFARRIALPATGPGRCTLRLSPESLLGLATKGVTRTVLVTARR